MYILKYNIKRIRKCVRGKEVCEKRGNYVGEMVRNFEFDSTIIKTKQLGTQVYSFAQYFDLPNIRSDLLDSSFN